MKTRNLHFTGLLLVLFLLSMNTIGANDIHGYLYYHNDPAKPLVNVNVYLSTTTGVVLDTAVTDAAGYYEFTNLTGYLYQVTASSTQTAGGIQIDDTFKILFYLLGWQTLNPVQEIAADVSGNGVVGWEDYFSLMTHWFLNGFQFPAGNWDFETATVDFSIAKGNEPTNIGGTSIGDVNGTFSPGSKSEPLLQINLTEYLPVNQGQNTDIPVTLDQTVNLGGMNLEIGFPSELAEVTGVSSAIPGLQYVVADGIVRVVWADMNLKGLELAAGQPLLTLQVKALHSNAGASRSGFTVASSSELTTPNGKKIMNTTFSIPGLNILSGEFYKAKNYPNPFTGSTAISYHLDMPSGVTVEVFDMTGNKISSLVNEFQDKGDYQVRFDGSSLNPGKYIYRILKGSVQENGIMVLAR